MLAASMWIAPTEVNITGTRRETRAIKGNALKPFYCWSINESTLEGLPTL